MAINNLLETQISVILQKHDIQGMLAAGAPDNDYDLEIPEILIQLKQSENVVALALSLRNMYERLLGSSANQDIASYQKLAEELYKLRSK